MRNMHKRVLSFICTLAILVWGANYAIAQEDEDIYEMDLEALMNMEIVSASKQSESLFDAAVAASVVTAEEIKKAGCTSVPEALRLIPGVIVREVTPGNYDIHLRGYDAIDPNAMIALTGNTITLVMINSRPVYNEFQGQTNWELLQLGINDIERIEIVRGPSSAMYGPNAVAGVINLITKMPDKKEGLTVGTYSQAGINNAIIGNANVGYNLGNGFSLRGGFNYEVRDRHNVDYYCLGDRALMLDPIYNKFPIQTEPLQTFVDELDTDILNQLGFIPTNPNQPPLEAEANIHDRFPNPDLATDRHSVNFHTRYAKGDDIAANIMAGIGSSNAQRVWARNQITALTNEEAQSSFAHLWGKIKAFNFSADYTMGENDIVGSGKFLSSEYSWLTANVDYDFLFGKKIKIKPGLTYRTASFNMYSLGSVVLNVDTYKFDEAEGDLTNNMMSGFLQGEYKTSRFRAIGAIRADKFDFPDKAIISPLIAATFKASDDFLVRASYGRSARTPFMMDLFFKIDLQYPKINDFTTGYTTLYNIGYRGTERADDIPGNDKRDYEPLIIDDLQVGFRHKISETFQLDIELFTSKLTNLVSTANIYYDYDSAFNENLVGEPRVDTLTMFNSYVNIDAEPSQTGVTIALTSAPFSNMTFQVFATMQQTKVKKYYEALNQNGEAIDVDGDGDVYIDDYYHKATPAFYGGVNCNYKPITKLNVNINAYILSHQELTFGTYFTEQADANILLNTTLTYEISKGISLFLNGRNLMDNSYRQFAFADKIGASYFIGTKIDL